MVFHIYDEFIIPWLDNLLRNLLDIWKFSTYNFILISMDFRTLMTIATSTTNAVCACTNHTKTMLQMQSIIGPLNQTVVQRVALGFLKWIGYYHKSGRGHWQFLNLILTVTLESLIIVPVLWKKPSKISCGMHFFCGTLANNSKVWASTMKQCAKMK